MARKSSKERFRANTMIIGEPKCLVLNGPKVRDGGDPDLLALSGKKQLLLGTVATQVERARILNIAYPLAESLARKRGRNKTQG